MGEPPKPVLLFVSLAIIGGTNGAWGRAREMRITLQVYPRRLFLIRATLLDPVCGARATERVYVSLSPPASVETCTRASGRGGTAESVRK